MPRLAAPAPASLPVPRCAAGTTLLLVLTLPALLHASPGARPCRYEIQAEGCAHDPREDAVAALRLYRWVLSQAREGRCELSSWASTWLLGRS